MFACDGSAFDKKPKKRTKEGTGGRRITTDHLQFDRYITVHEVLCNSNG